MTINRTALSQALKGAATIFVILALLVSVAFTGQGKAVAKPITPAAQQASADNQIGPAPAPPEQAGGKMAPDKSPSTATSTLLATPVVLNSNDHTRSNDEPSFDCDRLPAIDSRPIQGHLPHSACMISSSLGRQYTLIGAKPDGTM